MFYFMWVSYGCDPSGVGKELASIRKILHDAAAQPSEQAARKGLEKAMRDLKDFHGVKAEPPAEDELSWAVKQQAAVANSAPTSGRGSSATAPAQCHSPSGVLLVVS